MQRFSTEAIPARERLAAIHDFVGRHVAGRQFSLTGGAARIELAVLDLPGAMIGHAHYSPITGTRTRAMLADGRDDFLFATHNADHKISTNGGPALVVKAGELIAVSEAASSEFTLSEVRARVVALSRARLAGLLPQVERKAAHHVPAGASSLALFSGYADLLHATPPENDKAKHAASVHLHELAALVLDGFAGGETERSERSIRAARLELVKKEMLARLGEPDLSIGAVARSQSVSPRYLQRLFEADGRTFSEFLRDSRLDLALSLLRGADPNSASIAAIAFEAGFNDLSNFNRGFRRRFGMTPSDVRAETIRRRGH
ncbi:MAG TPA: helix-turn-helix transcriptional regulator [Rhizobiaceae bacterium]|nr:helix-turn-helix transcriptional regulator [Rhizobiaceae bacterium]